MLHRVREIWARMSIGRRCLLGIWILLLTVGWMGNVDQAAERYLDTVLERTLTAFAVARGTNAAISVLQDADLTVTPVGVGVTLSPGELLDPVNDLVEQLSSFLLIAATSLGIQRIGLELSQFTLVQWGLTILFVLGLPAWLSWRPWSFSYWAARFFMAAMLLRWLLPAEMLLMQAIDASLLTPRYEAALQELTWSRDQAQAVGDWVDAKDAEAPSLGERLSRLWPGTSGEAWQQKIQSLSEQLGRLSRSLIEIMVVFALQALVLPLAFVWLSGWLLRAIVRWSLLIPPDS